MVFEFLFLVIIGLVLAFVFVLCLTKISSQSDELLNSYYTTTNTYYKPEPFKYTTETIIYKRKRSKFVRNYIPRYIKR